MLRNVPNSYDDQNFGTFETHFLIGETSELEVVVIPPGLLRIERAGRRDEELARLET